MENERVSAFPFIIQSCRRPSREPLFVMKLACPLSQLSPLSHPLTHCTTCLRVFKILCKPLFGGGGVVHKSFGVFRRSTAGDSVWEGW